MHLHVAACRPCWAGYRLRSPCHRTTCAALAGDRLLTHAGGRRVPQADRLTEHLGSPHGDALTPGQDCTEMTYRGTVSSRRFGLSHCNVVSIIVVRRAHG